MSHFRKFFLAAMLFFIGLSSVSCSFLFYRADKPVIRIYDTLTKYQYFYIEKSDVLVAGEVDTDDDGDIDSYSTSINTSDMIAGYMMREGFVRLNEVTPELKGKTLVISYGESEPYNNRHARQVTLQFLRADNYELIATCTAEGNGRTHVDDIREAINTCFETLFPRKKK